MSENSEILFTGKINSDDEERFIPNGEVRDRKYLRIGTAESQNAGTNESYLGNELKAFGGGFLPVGTNTCIGSCKDPKRNGLIFFYHNSGNNHFIVHFDTINEAYQLIINGLSLGFDLDYPIHDARVVDDLLIYTDGKNSFTYYDSSGNRLFNPPMSINIEKGFDGFYTTVDLQSIELMKYPPLLAPTAVYGTELGVPNRIKQNLFEFRSSYISENGEETTLSPVSDMPMPNSSEWVQGPDNANPYNDNKITVSVNTGHYTIRKIRLYVRSNGGGWNLFQEVDKDIEGLPDNSVYQYEFFNDIALTPVDPLTDFNNNNVPQVVSHLDVLTAKSSAQVVLGNYVTDYDNVEMDYEVTPRYIEITNFKPDYCNLYSFSSAVTSFHPAFRVDDVARFDFCTGDTYNIAITVTDPSDIGQILLTHTIAQSEYDTANAQVTIELKNRAMVGIITQAFADQLNNAFGSNFVQLDFTFYNLYGVIIEPINAGVQPLTVTEYLRGTLAPIKPTRRTGVKRSLKKGWIYYFAIEYSDRGKRGGTVQKQTGTYKLKIPWPNEADLSQFTDPNSPYYVLAKLTINNAPPIWADTFAVVVKKVRTSFEQRSLKQVSNSPDGANLFVISLENWYENKYGATIEHQIQEGDVVRFVTRNYTTAIEEPAPYTEEYVELQVLKYDPSGGEDGSEAIWVNYFDTGLITNGSTFIQSQLLEIYTQAQITDQTPWYEIATFEIGDKHLPTRYHAGSMITDRLEQPVLNGSTSFSISGINPINGLPIDYSFLVGYDIYFQTPDPAAQQMGQVVTAVYNAGTGITDITTTDAWTLPDSFLGGSFVVTLNQNVALGVPAIIDLDWGDIYFRQVQMSTGFDGVSDPKAAYYWVEDPSYSAFFNSAVYPIGRVTIENVNNKAQIQSESILHSQVYLNNTFINGLSDYTGLNNFLQLNSKDGPIRRIVTDGQTTHVVQEMNTYPVYRGTYSTGADGQQSQPAFTTNTFGDIGRAAGFGSKHTDSVRLIDGIVFLYDFFRGQVAVLTNNGQEYISGGTFKFLNRITSKTNAVRADYDNYKIFAFVDELNKEYVLMFNNGVDIEGFTFNYENKFWSHVVDYDLRWAENLGTYLMSTNGTNLYKHNSGNELEFYGAVKQPELTFVFNDNPNLEKKLLAMGQKSNLVWDVDSIIISPSTNYPTGMESQIPSGLFEPKESYLWSAYLNDETNIVASNPDLVDADHALINGRNLIGPSALHTLKATITEKIILYSVKIVYELSRPFK